MTKLRGFEVISKYEGAGIPKPVRKTDWSAGYDIAAAESVTIQPLGAILSALLAKIQEGILAEEKIAELQRFSEREPELAAAMYEKAMTLDLDTIKKFMKENSLKPTLIPTGYKAYMQQNERLDLIVRSSAPLNSFIILANSLGLIDADYYNNPDNEGHIYFQVINLSPVPLVVKKGDIIGQGIFSTYLTTDDDADQPKQPRTGGFGSTSK